MGYLWGNVGTKEGIKEGRGGGPVFMDSRGQAKGGHSVGELPPWVSGLNSAARVLPEKG